MVTSQPFLKSCDPMTSQERKGTYIMISSRWFPIWKPFKSAFNIGLFTSFLVDNKSKNTKYFVTKYLLAPLLSKILNYKFQLAPKIFIRNCNSSLADIKSERPKEYFFQCKELTYHGLKAWKTFPVQKGKLFLSLNIFFPQYRNKTA